jgi:hypothetical protein
MPSMRKRPNQLSKTIKNLPKNPRGVSGIDEELGVGR